MKYSAFIGIGMASILFGISSIFSPVFWGKGFEKCSELLKLFSISIPFMCFAEVIRTLYIIPKKKDKIYIRAVIIGALVNVSLNVILIPKLGVNGAVIGTILAEISVCIYQSLKVRNDIAIKKMAKEFMYLLPAGLITGFAILKISSSLQNNFLNLLFILVMSVIIFILLNSITIYIIDRKRFENQKQIIHDVLTSK